RARKQLFISLIYSTCHRMDAQGRGANCANVYKHPVLLEEGRTIMADDNYIGESILNPAAKLVSGFKPIMPTFQGIISEEQLNALVAYIKSLSQPTEGEAGSRNTPAASPSGQPQTMQVQ